MKLKDVACADGQLRFRIPAGWTEVREGDGEVAYYDETLDQGTLRVKLSTFTTEDDLRGHRALDELAALEAEPGQTLEELPDGSALRFHREEIERAGERTVFHVWLLANLDPPHRMRLAIFSLMVRATEERQELLAVLDTEIRRSRFGQPVS